jgi:hypothetical protein
MRIWNKLSLVIALVAASGASASFGATITYTDRATWEAAVTGESTIDFDHVVGGYTPPAPGGFTGYSSGLTISGVTFNNFLDSSTTPFTIYANNAGYATWNSATVLRAQDYTAGHTNYFRVALPTGGVNAFGVDLMNGSNNLAGYTVVVGASTWAAPTFASPTRAFFGITSTTAITSVDLQYTSGTPLLDNFSTATPGAAPAATPDVASLLLCASGLVLISRVAKRKNVGLVSA